MRRNDNKQTRFKNQKRQINFLFEFWKIVSDREAGSQKRGPAGRSESKEDIKMTYYYF